jgi:hypothetical protein
VSASEITFVSMAITRNFSVCENADKVRANKIAHRTTDYFLGSGFFQI